MAEAGTAFQLSPGGAPPEQVLVFETVGPVDAFVTAVKNTAGLGWLTEWITEEYPDQDFSYADRTMAGKPVEGRLYLVVADQRAITEIRSLWRRFKRSEAFPRGQTGWRGAFEHLKDVRPWSEIDRIMETGIVEDWEERLREGEPSLPFEIELWFRSSVEAQSLASTEVTRVLAEEGGRKISEFSMGEIGYHAILAEAPADAVRRALTSSRTKLVRCPQVMHFWPVGQALAPRGPEPTHELSTGDFGPLPVGRPSVALLDGAPLEMHVALDGRLIVDDPEGLLSHYLASDRIHGTAMASLIAHGDLNEPARRPITTPLYVRPIMQPVDHGFGRRERIPIHRLPADMFFRSITRMLDGESGQEPIAPTVRVVNVSIGDPSHQVNRQATPWARMLDYLSARYQILFVVSAGNAVEPLSLRCSRGRFDALTATELKSEVFAAIRDAERFRTLISPAESINSLTVGAVHSDAGGARSRGGAVCEIRTRGETACRALSTE